MKDRLLKPASSSTLTDRMRKEPAIRDTKPKSYLMTDDMVVVEANTVVEAVTKFKKSKEKK